MQGRNWIILAIAVAVGLIAVVLANSYFSGVEQRSQRIAEQQNLARIVVATQPMEFGTELTAQNVRLQNWPAASVPEGAFMTVPDALKDNRVALRPIVKGEPVLASKVSGTDGRATLAALLPDGMRAVSIPVNAVNSVSGFVLPGTMVDVLLTRPIGGDGAEREDLRSDIVLQNVQVLAMDQNASEQTDQPKVSKTATLALTLFDAQRIAIAQKMGTLSLALRKVESAAGPGGGTAGRFARTVTNRQLGLPNIRIAKRKEGGAGSVPVGALGLANPGISGPSMTIVRGTDPTVYPIGHMGGM